MLVLAAVFQHPALRCYVSEEVLKGLFNATISLLRKLGTSDSSLCFDLQILQAVQENIFKEKQVSQMMYDTTKG